MTYLDYSATTPVDSEVLDSFIKSVEYFANPNSLHKIGVEAKKLIDASTEQIARLINVKPSEIIYTSGASESNNTVIKGMDKYKNRGYKIITTELEHSSIYGPLNYLTERGFEVQFVPLKNGIVDIKKLESMLDETVLVTISMVNSETGIRQPIEEIGKMLKKYPKVLFHTDITQALGKIKFDLKDVDFASFSAHKFFGLKGIGGLYKKESINLYPLINGGKSTTKFRSGTPATPLIVSTAKALRLSYENMDEDLKKVKNLNEYLCTKLSKYSKVVINSNENSIKQVLNFSVLGVKPEVFMHSLEEDDVYISTQSACSLGDYSKAVYALTNDMKRASSSLRVSISRKTTKKDIDNFLKAFDRSYNKLCN
ncbi:MAG: cysteine desulfurase [Bacilli bacterium]|nr:cysteine desulfurase [Bacilli bacterium]